MVTVANSPVDAASATTSSATSVSASVVEFWLALANPSEAGTTTLTSSTPADTARSKPRRLSTSPMCETPSGRGTRSMTASASAIAGTSLGCTNEADSIRRAPAAIAWLISSTFASVSSTRALVLQAVAGTDLDDAHHRPSSCRPLPTTGPRLDRSAAARAAGTPRAPAGAFPM